jgi:DNA (cytosine-5)-methyltransferase 1
VCTAYGLLSANVRKNWIWWKMPTPPMRMSSFADLVEDDPADVEWHTMQETARLLAMMTTLNLKKVAAAKKSGQRLVGTVYKRTRLDKEMDEKMQRAEVRFDGIAGCLRTPAGGSSRQSIIVVNGSSVRSRLISSRETARLMGLPETYKLPENYNEAYHLTGDGVCVPVVRYLAKSLFEPILLARMVKARAKK